MVRAQVLQGRFEVLPKALGRQRVGFRGDENLVADAVAEGRAQFLLAVAVGPRRVEIGHAALVSGAEQLHGLRLRHALDGQRPETILRRHDSRPAQSDVFHTVAPFLLILSLLYHLHYIMVLLFFAGYGSVSF